MAKGLLAGMTDYSHQSFEDILTDIKGEIKNLEGSINKINDHVQKLSTKSYWVNNVPYDFRQIVAYSLKHYTTAKTEFEDILKEIQVEVKEHHCVRLNRVSDVAQEINREIGKVWHREYPNKDYGNPDFKIVEGLYAETRDMAVNLLDISNLAGRLRDYIGKTKFNMKNNPWISGSFYLFLAVVAFSGIAVISKMVHWTLLPFIIVGGLLIVGVVGAFQLKNDEKLKDETFVELIKETYKSLPFLKQAFKKGN